MAAVTAGAAEAPAAAPIDSLSCSLQASSGRSAMYAKPTWSPLTEPSAAFGPGLVGEAAGSVGIDRGLDRGLVADRDDLAVDDRVGRLDALGLREQVDRVALVGLRGRGRARLGQLRRRATPARRPDP